MNRDDIIRMAKEKGFFPEPITWGYAVITPSYDTVVRFAQMIAAAEREECAKIVDRWHDGPSSEPEMAEIAAEIRAMGNSEEP